MEIVYLVSVILSTLPSVIASNDQLFSIGVGIADITGPAGDINMLGYADPSQNNAGIHLRLFSRAVVIVDGRGQRVCYVTVEALGTSQLVKTEVVRLLQVDFGQLYNNDNLMISATHTHSGPGGYLQYLLYLVPSLGFIPDSWQAIVTGVVKSIKAAHDSITPGYIYFNQGKLLDTSINRSPSAYQNNPKEEKAKYTYDTDKTMSLLKLVDKAGKPLAMINWYAVHGTSMNHSNKLISSDNKGYAALLFEKRYNHGQLIGKGPFAALFSQSNLGDVSPNTAGPKCVNTGLPCDYETSTCTGKILNQTNAYCIASGPGKDMFESTKIIGERQYKKAFELFEAAKQKLSGSISFIYQVVDMSDYTVNLKDGSKVKTCKGAVGYSFGAGTVDGPGAPFFHQDTHVNETSPFWNTIRNLLKKPSKELIECQKPKPILVAAGEMDKPYQWVPSLIPTQIFKIGKLVIVGLPGEFTTMAGRRMRDAVAKVFSKREEVQVILSGLANIYSGYITTFEEYQIQRYEGGHTLFGQHTLQAYIQQFEFLARSMIKKQRVDPGPKLPDLREKQITLKTPVFFDFPSLGKLFGDVISDAKSIYRTGQQVQVVFVSAHPRNNVQLEESFLTVEKFNYNNKEWEKVATDADWETKFHWKRTSTFFGTSEATITWDIPRQTKPGKYRIKHFGCYKIIIQNLLRFSGSSRVFKVVKQKEIN